MYKIKYSIEREGLLLVMKSSKGIEGAANGSCILICSEFELDNAGSHRQTRWVKHYASLCEQVTVIFPRGPFKVGLKRFNNVNDVEMFRNSIIRSGIVKKTSRHGLIASLLRMAKYYLFFEFFVPSNFIIVFKLMRTLSVQKDTKVISISSPPFPFAFFCSVIAKACWPQVRLHLDMRDPWATHHTLGGYRPAKLLLEKVCMRRVDVVTAATRFMADEFRSYHGIRAQVVYNVATHIDRPKQDSVRVDDEKLIELSSNTSNPVRIVYVGTMPEGFYDVALLADWLLSLQKDKQYGDMCEWLFVGESDLLESKIGAHLNAHTGIRFSPRVAHEKAVEIMCNADVLLFLGHRFPGYLTTKLFEYLALGKPILPLFLTPNAESYKLIEDICGRCPSIQTYEEFKDSINNYHELPRLRTESSLHEMRSAYSRIARNLVVGSTGSGMA